MMTSEVCHNCGNSECNCIFINSIKPKYDIELSCNLENSEGNAFTMMGKIRLALREVDAPKDEFEEYKNAAISGDYKNLLKVSASYFRLVDDSGLYEFVYKEE